MGNQASSSLSPLRQNSPSRRTPEELAKSLLSDYYVPNDVFCDIFQFLERKHLEKCRFISQKWNEIFENYGKVLPLYLFPILTIKEVSKEGEKKRWEAFTYIPREVENEKKRSKKQKLFNQVEIEITGQDEVHEWRTRNLKNCVFKDFIMNVYSNELIDLFKRIFSSINQPIRIIDLTTDLAIEEIIPILARYVSTHHLKYNVHSEEWSYISRNPRLLDFPKTTELVNLKVFMPELDDLLTLAKCGLIKDVHRYRIEVECPTTNDRFLRELIEIFESYLELNKLVPKYSFNLDLHLAEKLLRHIDVDIFRELKIYMTLISYTFETDGSIILTRKDKNRMIIRRKTDIPSLRYSLEFEIMPK